MNHTERPCAAAVSAEWEKLIGATSTQDALNESDPRRGHC